MGFNKMFLPEVERLEDQLNKVGEFEFTRYWKKSFSTWYKCKSNDTARTTLQYL